MYFPFLKLRKWGKRTTEARRHNCAVLPQDAHFWKFFLYPGGFYGIL